MGAVLCAALLSIGLWSCNQSGAPGPQSQSSKPLAAPQANYHADWSGQPGFIPCTPHGIQQLLVRNGIDIEGAYVVIVGRSNIVGKPLAILLMQKAAGPMLP